jgi:hypothetical protein
VLLTTLLKVSFCRDVMLTSLVKFSLLREYISDKWAKGVKNENCNFFWACHLCRALLLTTLLNLSSLQGFVANYTAELVIFAEFCC